MSKPPILPVLLSYGWEDRRWGNGAWQKTRCPFHGQDKNPSASLNEDEQVFKCFTCSMAGDAYAIVMQADGVDFLSAKQKIKELTGHEDGGSLPSNSGGRLSSRLPLWTRERRGSAGRAGRRLSGSSSRGRH